MTSGELTRRPVEDRLLDALHAARVRREHQLRRQEFRKSHWLSSFAGFELERHHRSEALVASEASLLSR